MKKFLISAVVAAAIIGFMTLGTGPQQKAIAGDTGDNFVKASSNLVLGPLNLVTRPVSGLTNDNRSGLEKAGYFLPELLVVGPLESGLRVIGGAWDFITPGKEDNVVPNYAWEEPLFDN